MSPDAVAKRAGGRRLYNAVRQLKRELRWAEVCRLRLEGYTLTAISAKVGVSRRTIERDMVALMAYSRDPMCPTCGRMNALPRAWSTGSDRMATEYPHVNGVPP